MKRKLLHAVLVASMAVALSGCGNTSGINADAEKTQKATETENIEEERGTEVAAAEQKENTTGTPDENGNYLINGSFEEPDFSGWTCFCVTATTVPLSSSMFSVSVAFCVFSASALIPDVFPHPDNATAMLATRTACNNFLFINVPLF